MATKTKKPSKKVRNQLGAIVAAEKPSITQAQKDKWLAALRSGNYAQTHGALRADVGLSEQYSYCCLGVLKKECRLAPKVAWDAGLLSRIGTPDIYGTYQLEQILALLNDGPSDEAFYTNLTANVDVIVTEFDGQDFNYIADFIEDFLQVK